MLDITEFSNNELSLIVFNTENLYHIRNSLMILIPHLRENYKFNKDQLKVLLNDIKQDKKELKEFELKNK